MDISKGHRVGVRCARWYCRGLPQLFPLLDQQDKTARRLFSLGLEARGLQGIGHSARDYTQG